MNFSDAMRQRFLAARAAGMAGPTGKPDPLDSLESDEEYQRAAEANAKKYRTARPGDKGVVVLSLDPDPLPPAPTPPTKGGALQGVQGEADQPPPPSLFHALMNWWASHKGPNAAREVDEAANAALPLSVSGREAVLLKRKQLSDLDKNTKEE